MSSILDALLQKIGGTDDTRPAAAHEKPNIRSIDNPDPDETDEGTVDKPKVANDTPFPFVEVSQFSVSRQSPLRAPPNIPESSPGDQIGAKTSSSGQTASAAYVSPIRQDRSFESNNTTGSNEMSSAYSTPAELIFGPQSLPFVLHRRAVTGTGNTSPSKLPAIEYDHRIRHTSMPAVIVRLADEEDDNIVLDTAESHLPLFVANSGADGQNEVKMSTWRTEQVKYAKRARRGPDATTKPIPALHGPLSLPYARNPSGVDATIADKSAYLSHVFGLRAAVSPTFTDTARSASHRSNTDSFRSTSSGSVVHMRTRPTPADNASGPNGRAGGQGGRPLVVRDLHQNIGIWKGMGTKDKGEEIGKGAASGGEEVTHPYKSAPNVSFRDTLDNAAHGYPATSASAHPSASSMLRAQLSSNVPRLSPIPEAVDATARNLYRSSTGDIQALRAHQRGTSLPIPSRSASTTDFSARVDISRYPSSGLASAQAHVNLGTFTPVRTHVTSRELHIPAVTLQQVEGLLPSPQVVRALPMTSANPPANPSSKADASENWRQKAQQAISAVEHQNDVSPSNSHNRDENTSPDVMTIDRLFEKFGQQLSPTSSLSSPGPKDPAIKETFPLRVSSRTTFNPSTSFAATKSQPLRDTVGKSVNIVVSPELPQTVRSAGTSGSRTSLARGTPNAGKLLKKASTLSAKEKLPPMPTRQPTSDTATAKAVDVKGKGKTRK